MTDSRSFGPAPLARTSSGRRGRRSPRPAGDAGPSGHPGSTIRRQLGRFDSPRRSGACCAASRSADVRSGHRRQHHRLTGDRRRGHRRRRQRRRRGRAGGGHDEPAPLARRSLRDRRRRRRRAIRRAVSRAGRGVPARASSSTSPRCCTRSRWSSTAPGPRSGPSTSVTATPRRSTTPSS